MELLGQPPGGGNPIAVTVEDGTIVGVRPPADPPEGLPWITSGFLDAQVNGYAGADYSSSGFAEEHVRRIIAALARTGTTRHVPTVVTSPPDRILRNLDLLARLAESDADVGAAVPALHVEGPFISPEDGPRGAHDRAYVRDPDCGELLEWVAAARGRLRMVTMAPERPGAMALIERVVAEGMVAAIGHTAADGPTIARALDAGARVSTHLGNGSHPMIPRLRNYIWEQLAADRLTAGIICDGFHLPDAVIKVFTRAKEGRLFLVSDVGPCAGLAPGVYRWGSIDVEVFEDGHLGLPGTTLLAGAGHLLDRGVARLAAAGGLSLAQAVAACTEAPARVLGLPTARLGVGAAADLVLFHWSPGAPCLSVVATCLGRRLTTGQ